MTAPAAGPPPHIVARALIVAARRPPGRCVKSLRGAVVFDPVTGMVHGWGLNAPPAPFECTGTARCREVCRRICEHAEARAIAMTEQCSMRRTEQPLQLLHVKLGPDGLVTPSGPPSCAECSKRILAVGFIAGVWLYEEQALRDAGSVEQWFYYTAVDFHRRSLLAEHLYEEPIGPAGARGTVGWCGGGPEAER